MAANRGAGPTSARGRDERSVSGHTRTSVFRSIRVRMMLPILVATVGVVMLGVLRTNDALTVAAAADRAKSLAAASGQLVTMVHLVGREFVETNAALRDKAAWTSLDPVVADVDGGARNVAEAVATVRAAAPDLAELCTTVEQSLASLSFARSSALTLQDGSSALLAYYDVAMLALLAVVDAIPAHLTDTRLVQLAQSLALVGHLDRLAALQLDLIDRSLAHGELAGTDALALPGWVGEERTRLQSLRSLPTATDLFSQELSRPEISNADTIRASIMASRARTELNANGQVWLVGQTARIQGLDDLRQAFITRLATDATAAGRDARNDMYLTAGLSGLLACITLVTATALAVRTSRRLRRTRQAALAAARSELPNAISNVIAARDATAVRRALTASSARVDAMLTPGPDEIGELAAAFGGVHRQALRLAADQALLRMEVQAMFVALSRRGQTLVQRQIQLIDEFGREEADPEALARLFALDHLAARMRRNEENLLVLAGGEPGRWITRPVALADLLRAAAQEIEDYRRVEVVHAPDIAVSAQVVNDAIHLLAELMENATTFSPPATTVRVTAGRTAEGMTITVEDSGIGMPPEKLAEANNRLNQPSMLTSNLVNTMGLLVIARLAERHRLVVRLASRPAAGTVATVILPDRLLAPIGVDTIRPGGFSREIADAGRHLPVPAAAVTSLPRLLEPAAAFPHDSAAPCESAFHSAARSISGQAMPGSSIPGPSIPGPIPGPSMPGPSIPGPALPARPALPTYPPQAYPPTMPAAGPTGPAAQPASPPAHLTASAVQPALPQQRTPVTAETNGHPVDAATTSAGLPRRPDADLPGLDLTGREYLAAPPLDLPDPETVRARLSSLSQGIAAANRRPPPPVRPR